MRVAMEQAQDVFAKKVGIHDTSLLSKWEAHKNESSGIDQKIEIMIRKIALGFCYVQQIVLQTFNNVWQLQIKFQHHEQIANIIQRNCGKSEELGRSSQSS